MGKSAEASQTFPANEATVRAIAYDAVAQIDGRVRNDDRGGGPREEYLDADIPLTWRSWGERMQVRVTPRGSKTEVTVTSRCVDWWQLYDWGKNKRNVDDVLRYIDRMVGRKNWLAATAKIDATDADGPPTTAY